MFPQPDAKLMNAETVDSVVSNILKNDVGFYVTDIRDSNDAMLGWFPVLTPIPLLGSAAGLDNKYGAKLLDFQRGRIQEVPKLPNSPLPEREANANNDEILVIYTESFGKPTITLDGQALSPPELLDRLNQMFLKNPQLTVRIEGDIDRKNSLNCTGGSW
jgi:hypothetical protein